MDEWATLQTLRGRLSVAEAPTASWGVRNKRRYGGMSSSVGEDSKKSMAIGSRRKLL